MMSEVESHQRPTIDQWAFLTLVGLLCVTLAAVPLLPRSVAGSLVTQVFVVLLVIMAAIDVATGKVPNVLVYPAIAFMAVATASVDLSILADAALGGAAGLGGMCLLALLGRGSMGMGDVKFSCLIGFGLGWKLGLLAIGVGFAVGAVTAIPLLVFKIKNRKDSVPLTPFLAGGAIAITILSGSLVA